ncbi:MAG: DUF3592 domain-containing protein [Eubacteriaceae bacterium]|nr:DUF3592 domain-containing protein [Eubacteriaceae bacterium]
MNTENRLARWLKNSGPARVFVPIGIALVVFGLLLVIMDTGNYELSTGRITSVVPASDGKYDVGFTYTVGSGTYESSFSGLSGDYRVGDTIDVYYDPERPENISNSRGGKLAGLLAVAAGVALAAYGVRKSSKAFKKSKELDAATPGMGTVPEVDFEAYKEGTGVTEYYFRFDGDSLKPGYIMEDGERSVIFEGKMKKNALVGARTFEFRDHSAGSVTEHEVGHTVTEKYNEEVLSARSWFKFDGENIWDVLHSKGIRVITDMRSRFPYIVYDVSRDTAPFARIETSSVYVHEEDELQHRIVLPAGKMYYRIWTSTDDFDLLFLTVFAISETEQTVVE